MSKLRILHVITSLSKSQGGPAVALPLIARALVEAGVEVTIATTDDDGRGARLDVPLGEPVAREDGITVFYFRKQTEFYRFSWPLTRWLWRNLRRFDIVHIHALFTYTSTAAGLLARWKKVPYIVRPLGVLNQWGMQNRRRHLKRWSMRLFEVPVLHGAACIHYTSAQEQREAVAAGAGEFPSTIIPLGIDVASYRELPPPSVFRDRHPAAANRDLILFLSRLDAKKGLDLLLPAFVEVHRKHPASLLVIAGDGEPAYMAMLRKDAERLGLGEHQVLWTGFVTGAEKKAAFAAATVFVLPSYSENFGIAAAEALAAGVPSVLTDQVALAADAMDTNSALVVGCNADELVKAIDRLITDKALRAEVRRNGARMMAEQFSLRSVSDSLLQLYNSVKKKFSTTQAARSN